MLQDSKILIVDDDELNIHYITTLLDGQYKLTQARNGAEAIKIIPNLMPDLVLLDWNMPVIDGMGVLKFMKDKAEFASIQTIMMTGLMTSLPDLLEAFDNGAVDFLKKPFEFPELQARIKSSLKIAYYHKQELQKKSQELVQVTMTKIENIEFLKTIFKALEEEANNNECSDKLRSFRAEFNYIISQNTWKDFDDNFAQVYPSFYTSVIQVHPDLSPAELRLCRLLRMNLSTKEMASLTMSTPESLKVARSRLRKKMDLQGATNLVSYIMQF